MNVVMWGHSVFWGAVRRWVIQEKQSRERMLDGEMVSSSSQVWGKRREKGGADLIPETQILGRKAIVLYVHPRASWPWRWGWELTRAVPVKACWALKQVVMAPSSLQDCYCGFSSSLSCLLQDKEKNKIRGKWVSFTRYFFWVLDCVKLLSDLFMDVYAIYLDFWHNIFIVLWFLRLT